MIQTPTKAIYEKTIGSVSRFHRNTVPQMNGTVFQRLFGMKRGGDYLTDPVIPSANCFCITKKRIMVGSEQHTTPNISTP